MTGSYDFQLVGLSVLIAAIAAFAAFAAAEWRAECKGDRRACLAWLGVGAAAMGFGVWCMHFVGMLAFRLPIPVRYSLGWTLASLIPAVGSSGIAILCVSSVPSPWKVHLGGVLLGVGIGSMHYMGMAAMILDARMAYDPFLFALSLLVAYGLATAALHVRFRLQASALEGAWRKILAAGVMGCAVAGMHYTGMSATRYFGAVPAGASLPSSAFLVSHLLGAAAASVGAVVVGVAYFDRRLSASALRTQKLIETAPDAFVVVDPGGRICLFNAQAERVFGYGRAEALGRPLEMLLPERFRASHAPRREEYGREPSVRLMGTGGEFVGRRKDGSEFPIEVSLSPERSGTGLFVTSIIRDISDRVAARKLEGLVEIEHRVSRMLSGGADPVEAAPDIIRCICEHLGFQYGGWWLLKPIRRELHCVAVWHAGGKELEEFADASRAISFKEGRGLPGRVLSSGRGAWIVDVLADSNFLRTAAASRAALRAAFAFPLHAGGETLGVMDFLSSRVLEPDARLLAMLESLGGQIGQNLKRRQAEHLLAHAQRIEAVGRLAGGIAHDFNNHLTGIIGLANLLRRELEPGTQAAADAADILDMAGRAAHLTRGLLALNRRPAKASRGVDANALIAKDADLLGRLVTAEIRIETRLCDGPLPVGIDPGELSQVLMNLVVNARDAMPSGGVISISSARGGAHAEISVKDTGAGIPLEIQGHIFDPYFSTKEESRGTGLGLSIVSSLLRGAGGAVEVESAPGHGAKFIMRFPFADGPAAAETGQSRAARPREPGGLVLLVEDNLGVARVTRRMLESLGYEVLEAADAGSALARFRERGREISLVITDVNMPGANGVTLSEQIRAVRPDAKVLFVSGFGQDVFGPGEQEERRDFLAKPFTADVLASRIEELLGDGLA